MSERGLDNVIHYLRRGITYFDTSMEIADNDLTNHQVTTDIMELKLKVMDYIEELDLNYRQTHFVKKHRR